MEKVWTSNTEMKCENVEINTEMKCENPEFNTEVL